MPLKAQRGKQPSGASICPPYTGAKLLAKFAGSGSIAASAKKRPENQNNKFAASAAVHNKTRNL
jgi:hypothetical protein